MKTEQSELIGKVVQLGNVVRRYRSEGKLQSVAPPTIYGYMAFLRMAMAMPHMNEYQLASATLLGNGSVDDQKYIASVFNEVFGLQAVDDEDPTIGGNLF